jgi:hypothetical protein
LWSAAAAGPQAPQRRAAVAPRQDGRGVGREQAAPPVQRDHARVGPGVAAQDRQDRRAGGPALAHQAEHLLVDGQARDARDVRQAVAGDEAGRPVGGDEPRERLRPVGPARHQPGQRGRGDRVRHRVRGVPAEEGRRPPALDLGPVQPPVRPDRGEADEAADRAPADQLDGAQRAPDGESRAGAGSGDPDRQAAAAQWPGASSASGPAG